MGNTRFYPLRVAVVGTGNVGTTFAYTLLLSGLAAEIVLIDANQAKAEGEAMDLNHAIPFTYSTRIWAGDYSDCAGAIVTVIAAGSAQKPGETRLDLLKKNAAVFRQVVPEVVRHNPDGILLIATNPVDVLTYAVLKLSGFPPQRVIGSGTILDTGRFRYLIGQYYKVDPHSVHAYIIGEHGDSEVPVWSLANVAGMPLSFICAARGLVHDQTSMDQLFYETRDAAYKIIERKGATYYAVAAGLLRIVEAVIRNQRTLLPVSFLIEDYYGISDVCMSLPAFINQDGVDWVLRLHLNPEEIESLRRSAETLKKAITELQL